MTLRKAITQSIQTAFLNLFDDMSRYDETEVLCDNMEKIEYFSDVPCVITDKDGNEWWIKVEKKRK
jgi:hypothetical protein